MRLHITIDGHDWSAILPSISITKALSGRYSSASFNIAVNNVSTASNLPVQYSEVIIYNTDTSVKVFRGIVDSITIDQKSGVLEIWQLSCSGLEYLLDNAIINATYTGQTDRQIIQSAFGSALPEITTLNATVAQLLVAQNFQAKDLTLHQLMDQICQLSGAEYRITENKELSYRAAGSVLAPFSFSDRPNV